MTPNAYALSEKIFRVIADAESKAHGVPADEVHFHEVGAVDSIVDVVAVAVCFDSLGVRDCIFPQLCEGSGSVRSQHGILPVPVPAVLNIVQAHGLPLSITNQRGELVTPTGAAIAAALMTSQTLPERFKILKTGIGAGKRAYERPSLLRVMLIESGDAQTSDRSTGADVSQTSDRLTLLETNLDDCTGEALGFAMEELFKAGAKDVWHTPIYMKKNRPAYLLSVLCAESDRETMERLLFAHTTTIGIRRTAVERTELPRRVGKIKTSYGEIGVKFYGAPDAERVSLEYESVAAICRATGESFRTVADALTAEIARAADADR